MKCFGIFTSLGTGLPPGLHNALVPHDEIHLVFKSKNSKYSDEPFVENGFPPPATQSSPPCPLIVDYGEYDWEPDKLNETPLWFNWDTAEWWNMPYSNMQFKIETAEQLQSAFKNFCGLTVSKSDCELFFGEELGHKQDWAIYWKEKFADKQNSSQTNQQWFSTVTTGSSFTLNNTSVADLLDSIAAVENTPNKPLYSWVVRNNGVVERFGKEKASAV